MAGLVDALGANRSAIYRRLAGDVNMTATTIGALAKALGLKPNDRLFVSERAAHGANDVHVVSGPAPTVYAFVHAPQAARVAVLHEPKATIVAEAVLKVQAEWNTTLSPLGTHGSNQVQATTERAAV